MGIADREKNRESKARQEAIKMLMTTASSAPTTEVMKESKAESSAQEVTKRKGRPAVNRETKKRYTLTLLPSVYDAASKKAYEQGKTLSEVVGDFLSEFVKD